MRLMCQLRIQGHHQSLSGSHGNGGKHLMDPYLTENVKDVSIEWAHAHVWM